MVHCVHHNGSVFNIGTQGSRYCVLIELTSPFIHGWPVACLSKAFSIDVVLLGISYSHFCSFRWLRYNSLIIKSVVFSNTYKDV